jgi:hypothetical protein
LNSNRHFDEFYETTKYQSHLGNLQLHDLNKS